MASHARRIAAWQACSRRGRSTSRDRASSLRTLLSRWWATSSPCSTLPQLRQRPIHRPAFRQRASVLFEPRTIERAAIFITDVRTPTTWSARYLHMNAKRRLLGSFTHATMTNALPQVIGAQASQPGRQVVTLSGDGGLATLLGELITLRQTGCRAKHFARDRYRFVWECIEGERCVAVLRVARDARACRCVRSSSRPAAFTNKRSHTRVRSGEVPLSPYRSHSIADERNATCL